MSKEMNEIEIYELLEQAIKEYLDNHEDELEDEDEDEDEVCHCSYCMKHNEEDSDNDLYDDEDEDEDTDLVAEDELEDLPATEQKRLYVIIAHGEVVGFSDEPARNNHMFTTVPIMAGVGSTLLDEYGAIKGLLMTRPA